MQVVQNLPRYAVDSHQWAPCICDCIFPLSLSPPSLLLICRVMRDVEAVRQEATLLKEQMHIVKEDIKKVSFILLLHV